VLRCAVLLALVAGGSCLFGLDTLGGTFRYGHVHWQRVGDGGNTVAITVETAFRRNVGTTYFHGSAPDGFAQVGDTVTLTGRQTPKVYLGDATIVDVMRMKVTSYSVAEDWIMGEVYIEHTYETPSNKGVPWEVQYSGCCRLSSLQNSKDQEWMITALVDLSRAVSSPRVQMLPIVHVPFEDNAQFVIPATSASNQEVVHWSIAKPFQVGDAAGFSGSSSISVSLKPSFQNSSWGLSNPCILRPTSAECGTSWVDHRGGPSYFDRLLRGDNLDVSLTVEGWVLSTTVEGGVVVSTGRDSTPTASGDCAGLAGADRGMCEASTLMVAVNATHVTVGHELWTGTAWVLQRQAFAVCSNTELCADLSNVVKYPAAQGDPRTTTNKWVHVAVVRRTKANLQSKMQSTYAAYVNGFPLEMDRFPGCSSTGTCRGRPSDQEVYVAGESEPINGPRKPQSLISPPTTESKDGQCYTDGNANSHCTDLFGTRAALVFGSFMGATSTARTFFTGKLDEWRFWNGVRTRTDLLEAMQRPLTPRLEASYGDPTSAVTADGSVLMALWSFDGMRGTEVVPVYPKIDSRMPPISKFDPAAYNGYNMGVQSVETDDSGVVFYGKLNTISVNNQGRVTMLQKPEVPGLYQATVLLALPENSSQVMVDFVVNVTDPAGVNVEMPRVEIMAAGGVGGALATFPVKHKAFQGFEFGLQLKGSDGQVAPVGCLGSEEQCKASFRTSFGFTLGPMPPMAKFSTVRDTNPGYMDMAWTPCAGDLGVTTMCFDAVDLHSNVTTGASLPSKVSQQRCVSVDVVSDPAPSLTLYPGTDLTVTMGNETNITAVAFDTNCNDRVEIEVRYGLLVPIRDTRRASQNGCGGVVTREMIFKPSLKMGGYSEEICIHAVDSGGSCPGLAPHRVTRCFTMTVARCAYALQLDEPLQDLAEKLGMDWIRLWSLNQALMHPDTIVYSGQRVSVGMMYRVAPKDTVADLIRRMGMPLDQLQSLNYGLSSMSNVSAGLLDAGVTELCVVPNPCTGMRTSVYSGLVYRNGAFVVPPPGTAARV